MEENDVLDDLEDLEPEVPEHRRRCFRFLWYSLGIGVVMVGQIWVTRDSALSSDVPTLSYLNSLGVVGVWLFAGLGSLAGIREVRQERTDLLLVGALTMHLVSLSLSTGFLYNFIFVP
jgi:hypothetical protein